jgi:hypothetical protein
MPSLISFEASGTHASEGTTAADNTVLMMANIHKVKEAIQSFMSAMREDGVGSYMTFSFSIYIMNQGKILIESVYSTVVTFTLSLYLTNGNPMHLNQQYAWRQKRNGLEYGTQSSVEF